MINRSGVPIGLDIEQMNQSTARQSSRTNLEGTSSKHFPNKQPSARPTIKPTPIIPPSDYSGPSTGYQPSSDMSKRHDTRNSSKVKGNENPYAPGKNTKPKIAPKPAAVSPSNFYAKPAKSGSITRPVKPEELPSPTDYTKHNPKGGKGKSEEQVIIDVESEEEDQDSIEDSDAMHQLSSGQNPRASMQIAGQGRRQPDEDPEIVHVEDHQVARNGQASRPVPGASSNAKQVAAKSHMLGKRGVGKPSPGEVMFAGPSNKFHGIEKIMIDGLRVPPEQVRKLVLVCEPTGLVVRRTEQGDAKGDLQIPQDSSIDYWVASQSDKVLGLMLDGQVSQRIREEWYNAIPGVSHTRIATGRQRFLLSIELQDPMPRTRFTRHFTPLGNMETVISTAALQIAYVMQINSFEAEAREAKEEAKRTAHRLPSPSNPRTPNSAVQSSKTSTRAPPKRRAKQQEETDAPDKDGLRQTRIQPERTARAETQTTATETVPKKAPAPKFPDVIMREWPSVGRTEINITHGDFYRLEEAEYLNDTLIEFGLKYYWSGLDDENVGSTEAFERDDIHILNSFFYKKLSVRNKPGYREANPDGPSWPAYETVRKWTNKVDVFSKKMLVIPINENLHWYLAIVLNPGAILAKTWPKDDQDDQVDPVDANTEAEKEAVLSQQLEDEKRQEQIDQAKELAQRSDGINDDQDPLDVISGRQRPKDDDDDDDSVVIDLPDRESDLGNVDTAAIPQSLTGQAKKQPIPIVPPSTAPVPLAPPAEYGPPGELKSTRRGPIVPVAAKPQPPRTNFQRDEPVIMTFDSLAAAHQPVGKLLNKWLVYEARDKVKGRTMLEETNWDVHFPAAYKAVRVPGQDNFADCGIYVLHYAIQLMKDAGTLQNYIFDQATVKTAQAKEKNKEVWDAQDMSIHRNRWKQLIQSLPENKGDAKDAPKSDDPSKEKRTDGEEKKSTDAVPTSSVEEAAPLSGITTAPTDVILPPKSAPSSPGNATSEITPDRTRNDGLCSQSKSIEHMAEQPVVPLTYQRSTPQVSPPRSSPMKRTIAISPIAPQDEPVNKRRRIVPEVPTPDIVEDSEQERSPSLETKSLFDDRMQVDNNNAEYMHSDSQTATPKLHSSILAPESPAIIDARPPSPPGMTSLTNGFRDVQVAEAGSAPSDNTSGRPSMASPHNSVISPRNAATTQTSPDFQVTRPVKRDNPRDRLRRDNNAEPPRSLPFNGSVEPIQMTSRVTPMQPKSTAYPSSPDAEALRLAALQAFGLPEFISSPDEILPLEFRDTAFGTFRKAFDAGDDHMVEKLKRHHLARSQRTISIFCASEGEQPAPDTSQMARGAAIESRSKRTIADGPAVVDVSSDEEDSGN